ncbi:hypothetical protein E2C01_003986 [Portunus trituberculatus]|uniref:Uncharacterized protein n=1 Tax=Portunus trituberculatus TaxID=210409 RepID=A0A5B7CRN4_PORTR|nr:hypothetical protein [Portunus trituberculatus]
MKGWEVTTDGGGEETRGFLRSERAPVPPSPCAAADSRSQQTTPATNLSLPHTSRDECRNRFTHRTVDEWNRFGSLVVVVRTNARIWSFHQALEKFKDSDEDWRVSRTKYLELIK